jgi:hypothetical protein
MAALTSAELNNILNSTLDYHIKEQDRLTKLQHDIERPLLRDLRRAQKTFPGSKQYITQPVKGVTTTRAQGFQGTDTVTYGNPTNVKQAQAAWYMLHAGISFTKEELLKNGITILDGDSWDGSRHSQNDLIQLVDLLKDKFQDLTMGFDQSMDEMYWKDGSQDAKAIPGITSFILDDPTAAGTILGLDQVANPWWQNYADVGLTATVADAENQTLAQSLQKGIRKQRTYGGRPNRIYAGADFIEVLEAELRSKGYYSMDGFMGGGKNDMGIGELAFKRIPVIHVPTLDVLGKGKYAYVLDTSTIYPMVVQDEDRQKHAPARPETQYVYYRALTYAGGLICTQRNANGVYSIA